MVSFLISILFCTLNMGLFAYNIAKIRDLADQQSFQRSILAKLFQGLKAVNDTASHAKSVVENYLSDHEIPVHSPRHENHIHQADMDQGNFEARLAQIHEEHSQGL